MRSGVVKWFNVDKGYGFIIPDDGGRDLFVHISAVERAGLAMLNEKQRIEFTVKAGRNGRDTAQDLSLL